MPSKEVTFQELVKYNVVCGCGVRGAGASALHPHGGGDWSLCCRIHCSSYTRYALEMLALCVALCWLSGIIHDVQKLQLVAGVVVALQG